MGAFMAGDELVAADGTGGDAERAAECGKVHALRSAVPEAGLQDIDRFRHAGSAEPGVGDVAVIVPDNVPVELLCLQVRVGLVAGDCLCPGLHLRRHCDIRTGGRVFEVFRVARIIAPDRCRVDGEPLFVLGIAEAGGDIEEFPRYVLKRDFEIHEPDVRTGAGGGSDVLRRLHRDDRDIPLRLCFYRQRDPETEDPGLRQPACRDTQNFCAFPGDRVPVVPCTLNGRCQCNQLHLVIKRRLALPGGCFACQVKVV